MDNKVTQLEPGIRFDTPYESGCVVITRPDQFGAFDAYDSDGVCCSFSVQMVSTIRTRVILKVIH